MPIDEQWALTELRAFISATTLVSPPQTYGDIVFIGDDRATRAPRDEVVAAAEVVEQILDQISPRWRTEVAEDQKHRWEQHREAAQRAVVRLERAAEVRAKLGENAPTLDAGRLHPWVWEGARSLWQSEHYREAVTAAARKLNAEAQNKLARRDVSETDLSNQAFSNDEPKAGQPRLRLPEDDGGKSALSVRQGLRAYAQGCFAAIRNPAAHDVLEELAEHEALEQLAAFSVLARWVERASLVSAA